MLMKPVLYPRLYPWLLLAAALDVMLTWLILELGGRELNGVARAVIDAAGLPGMLAFKFALILVVIVACEIVGRRSATSGLRLAGAATGISCVPVAVSLVLVIQLARMAVTGQP